MGEQTPDRVTNPPARKVETYEKRALAARLRREGHTWAEVAAGSGYADKASAYVAVRTLMIESRELAYGEADLYRAESLDRLTALLKAVWPKATEGSEKHVGRAMQLIKQMDDLTGASRPTEIQIGMGDVDALLRAAQQELGRRVASAREQVAGGADDDDTAG